MGKTISILITVLTLFVACDIKLKPFEDEGSEHRIEVCRYDRLESQYLTTGDFSALQPDAYYTHALEYLPANSLSPYKVWSLAGAKISDDGQIRVTVDGADRIVYAAYAQDAYTPLNESSDLVLNEYGTLLFKTGQLFYKTPASDTAYTALNPDPAGERSEWVISAEYEYVPLDAKSGDDYVLVTVEEGDGYAVDGENGGRG